ncbi:hypothetical protein ACXYN8_10745 [Altererythrobacter sp. CAU 1778]
MFKQLAAATSALALTATPLVAQAAAMDAPVRAAAPMAESNGLVGGEFGKGLLIAAIAAVGMAILLISDDNDDDDDVPFSP